MPAIEECPLLPTGEIRLCLVASDGGMDAIAADAGLDSEAATGDASGPPYDPRPQRLAAYLEIAGLQGGKRLYACATSWSSTIGYRFSPDRFVTDPAVCCTPEGPSLFDLAPAPTVQEEPYLGQPHGPVQVKPQELSGEFAGPLQTNPFTLVVVDAETGWRARDAIDIWKRWEGDSMPHTAPNGKGTFFFPAPLTINFSLIRDSRGRIVAVIGPEVATDSPAGPLLGHPTLGACETGGLALCLVGGEIVGNTINNNSGRCGSHVSVTAEALTNAAAILRSYGFDVSDIDYHPTGR